MLNLFIFWRKKTKFVHIKQSLYLSFRPFCQWRNWFSVNHLSRAKSPQKLTIWALHEKKSFSSPLHLQLVEFSDRRSYWSVFCRRRCFAEAAVGVSPENPILPQISRYLSPVPRCSLFWSQVKSESGWIWLLPSESFAVSATNSWTAEAVQLASRQQP